MSNISTSVKQEFIVNAVDDHHNSITAAYRKDRENFSLFISLPNVKEIPTDYVLNDYPQIGIDEINLPRLETMINLLAEMKAKINNL